MCHLCHPSFGGIPHYLTTSPCCYVANVALIWSHSLCSVTHIFRTFYCPYSNVNQFYNSLRSFISSHSNTIMLTGGAFYRSREKYFHFPGYFQNSNISYNDNFSFIKYWTNVMRNWFWFPFNIALCANNCENDCSQSRIAVMAVWLLFQIRAHRE